MKVTSDILLEVLNNIPDIFVLLVDRENIISLAIGNELGKVGLEEDEITGKELTSVFDTTVTRALLPMLEVSSGGTTVSHEMMIGDLYFYVQALPISTGNDDELLANMMFFENLTEYKVNADKLRIAREAADNSNRLKSIFLANMSHEIRTPLNTIIGFTEQMSKSAHTREQNRFLEIIQTSSEYLLSMVNKIITLSEIEAGEINFEKRPFLVSEVIQEVLLMESNHANKKDIALKDVSEERIDIPVYGDDVSLVQILLNLVNNAVKFTMKGHVHVSAQAEHITENSLRVHFRVQDTGIGIPENELRMIFEDFTQASTRTGSYGGSGLGLTIANKLVQLQGGTLEVESEPDKGTVFLVSLSYDKAGEDKAAQKKRKLVDPEVLNNVSILYVDDDENNRLLGKLIFENWDVDHDIAPNGIAALEMASRKEYDIILLDIRMPGMDGLQVAGKLGEIYRHRQGRYSIIAVTANAFKKDVENYLRAGMDGYLMKPFRELDLYDVIVRHVLDDKLGDNSSSLEIEPSVKHTNHINEISYDLSELEQVTANNRTFFNKMIKTFISNAGKDLLLMKQQLEHQNWKSIGELAHKMLPSYRHLNILKLVEILENIEEKALILEEYDTIPDKVESLYTDSLEVFNALEKELK